MHAIDRERERLAMDRIERLRRCYASSLTTAAAEVASLLALCADQTALPRAEIEHLSHRLAGSAGVFGHHTVSDHARHVELLCKRDAPDRAALRASLKALRCAIDRAVANNVRMDHE